MRTMNHSSFNFCDSSYPRDFQKLLNSDNPMSLNHLLNPSQDIIYLSPDSVDSSSSLTSDSIHEISKRRYRRHPKPDSLAPRKPQTAYILFSNAIRRGGHYKHMSFTESAQLVAQIWRDLDQTSKNVYLDRAEKDRAAYRDAVAAYRLTPAYREYKSYLTRFYNQEGQIVRSVGRPKKSYSQSKRDY